MTFAQWQRRLRWLPASGRARLFLLLPDRVQARAWRDLNDELERDRQREIAAHAEMAVIGDSVEEELDRLRREAGW